MRVGLDALLTVAGAASTIEEVAITNKVMAVVIDNVFNIKVNVMGMINGS